MSVDLAWRLTIGDDSVHIARVTTGLDGISGRPTV